MISARMRNIIAGVVTLVWAANFFIGVIAKDYDSDQAINGIFMAIVGGLFVASQKKPPSDPPGRGGEPSRGEESRTGGTHRG